MAKIEALVSKYAWVPIPLLLISILYTEISGVNYVNESNLLVLILNIIFTTLASLLIIYLISRSFLVSGKIGLILFGCGVLVWGFSGLLSIIFGNKDSNTAVTIHNLCVFLSAICYFTGACVMSEQKHSVKHPGKWLTIFYSFSLTLIALIIIFSTSGKTPVFFVEHKGGTVLRYVVLIFSIALFVATSIIVRLSSKGFFLKFHYWYSIAVGLISIGLVGVMLEDRLGDLLSWTGRSAQFLGGVYMIVAAFSLVKETNDWELSIEDEWIHKRQEAENALRKSEVRYQQIVELAGEGIIMTDEKFVITEWNRAAEILYGWTANEVIGRSSRDVLRSSMQEKELENLLTDLAERGVAQYEATQCRKDDSLIMIEAKLSVMRDDNGNVSGYIAMNRDITERKHDEKKLQEAQNTLNLALENGNIGIWQLNLKTNEIFWDERMENIFGLGPGMFGKTREAFESLVQEEDIPRLNKGLSELIEKDSPYDSLYRTRPVNGRSKYISSKALMIKDSLGKPVSVSGVSFDVTNLVEGAESKILRLNEELLRSNKELENFAYVASHDLQEPLRMVTSFTQLLQKRYGDILDEDANTYIQFAVDGSKRMYELLNGLLAYSRVKTRGKDFTRVDMNNVLDKVKANLKLKLEETQSIINCAELPGIMADESQMIQIMQNLIENGIKFCKRKPSIIISSIEEGGFNVFSVKDEGIGIEPQYYDRIFRIFQRLHSNKEYDGMGIGLSICQRIVERHEGKIWVESKPDQGSTFFFSVPIRSVN